MAETKADYRLLIVEDDPIIARVLETILKDSGFVVDEPVNSGEKAIARVALSPPGLVLMDIDLLGKISGIETAWILLHIFSVPVIFVTGHDEESVLGHAKEADPFGFLVKPVNQTILNTTIQVSINLYHKICGTTEGKTGGLLPDQLHDISGSLKSALILDDQYRILWMNGSAEFLLERSGEDIFLNNGRELLLFHDPESGETADILSLDPINERPLVLDGIVHERLVMPRVFMINDIFGDLSGYYITLEPADH
ncbi:MAG TPA: response regulator [Methanospirillum sp.]|nr:response regulator [Methanospirillum sp.]